MLKFAALLNAEYLGKKAGKEIPAEEALRDKLGLFVRRRPNSKGDDKKLKELFRVLLWRIQRKQDAEWESRKQEESPAEARAQRL
ncbi:MAG: hypothetical protein IT572_00810 [Deltaproteobacteria bacterium]|nr:hypothetical protein [Deltaproteobacteria bacterium]